MVTRIEPRGIQIAAPGGAPMERVVPQQVDYMVAAREQAREASIIGDVLDRMSQTVFGKAREMAREEALQFAATNPITDEQLQLAKEGLISAIPGVGKISGDFTEFGSTLKKARSLQLSAHFETEGRSELAKLLVDVQNNQAKSSDIATKIAVMTDGYAKSLAQVDSEAAIKFRATMATHGNTVLNAAYEAEQKRVKAQQATKFELGFDDSMALAEAAYTRGFWIDTLGNKRSPEDLVELIRLDVFAQSMSLGDVGIQKEYSEKLRVGIRNAKINVLSKHLVEDEFMRDPTVTLEKLRSRQIGKLAPLLEDLYLNDGDAYGKVVASFMLATNQKEETARRKRDETLRVDKAKAINLLEQIYPIKNVKDPKRMELVRQVMALTPESLPIGTIKELLEPKEEGDGNPSAEYYALKSIYKNEIRNEDEIDRIPGLNFKQKLTLLKAFRSENKTSEREYESALNKLAGIPEDPSGIFVLNAKSDEWKKKQRLKAEGEQIRANAAAEGKTLTNNQVAKQLEENLIKRQNSAEAKAAKEALEYFVLDRSGRAKQDRDWITGPINRNTLPALRQKAEATKDLGDRTKRLRQVQEIERLITVSEGM